MEYGLQLYSVRDVTAKRMEYALEKVAEMGYHFVEFAGFFGHPAEEIKAMLEHFGLKLSGTHTGLDELTGSFAETVTYHKKIGNTNIIIPWQDFSSEEKIASFAKQTGELIPKLRAEGIALGYHNHAEEFRKDANGYTVHKALEERTELFFEIDTYWAYVAGVDPVELLTRLRERIRCIHLKDGTADGHGYSLGDGSAPVKEIRETAIKLGFPMIVESETLDPDGLSEVKRCIDFLHTLD